ncbi:MAG: hypothetical protein GQ557_00655 [Mycoplasmataceae bacterium]|nr:hypothetical protein [Mycoplasmataceae bacterium]
MQKDSTTLNYKKSNSSTKTFLSKLGSSLMLPISLLPIAALFIGFSSFFNTTEGISVIGNVLSSIGFAVISILPILFAITITISFSKNKNAPLYGLICYLFFIAFQSQFITFDSTTSEYNVSGFFSLSSYYFVDIFGLTVLNTSLFGGIVIGLVISYIANKNDKVGLNLLYLIMVAVFFAFIVLLFWPPIYYVMEQWFNLVNGIGFGINTFLYGFINRLLVPFGLHSLLIPLVTYSPAGGTLLINGDVVAQGDSAIWLYLYANNISFQEAIKHSGESYFYLGDTYFLTEGVVPGQYQQGFLPIMIFGFPAAGYAMTTKVENKKDKSIIMLAAITPLLTGITEPFEYLFIFIVPSLYFIHALLTGLSFAILSLAHTTVLISSGWFVDLILFGLIPSLQGNPTRWWVVLAIGPLFSFAYYISFKMLFKEEHFKQLY